VQLGATPDLIQLSLAERQVVDVFISELCV
jgi:hypothetical protein